jgi:transcriptional regulator with XRE-family HTH domain
MLVIELSDIPAKPTPPDRLISAHPLAHYRRSRNLKQKGMAALLKIDKSTVSRIESHTQFPSPELAFKIRDLTGIGLDVLFNRASAA